MWQACRHHSPSLTNLVTGVVAEYIRSDTLENIVKDDGTLRHQLKQILESSPSIRGNYNVGEVLKALPTGDERILEIIRKTREVCTERESDQAGREEQAVGG